MPQKLKLNFKLFVIIIIIILFDAHYFSKDYPGTKKNHRDKILFSNVFLYIIVSPLPFYSSAIPRFKKKK